MTITGPTLLEKWQFALQLASDSSLSRADIAIAMHLFELFNAEKGKAWPSYQTLGRRASCDLSTAKRSVKRLVSQQYITILASGNRRASNSYRPNFNYVRPKVADAPPSDCDRDTEAFMPENGGEHATFSEAATPPNSSYDPGQEAGEEEEAPAPPRSGAAATPTGVPPSGQEMEEGFERFRNSYPKQEQLGQAKAEFIRIVGSGEATMEDVIAGAARYAAWVKAVKRDPEWIKLPRNWLKNQNWVEPYEIPEPRSVREPKQQSRQTREPKENVTPSCDASGSMKGLPAATYVGQVTAAFCRLDDNETEQFLVVELEVLRGPHKGTKIVDTMRLWATDDDQRDAAKERYASLKQSSRRYAIEEFSELVDAVVNVKLEAQGRLVLVTRYELPSGVFLAQWEEEQRLKREQEGQVARLLALERAFVNPMATDIQDFGRMIRGLREHLRWSYVDFGQMIWDRYEEYWAVDVFEPLEVGDIEELRHCCGYRDNERCRLMLVHLFREHLNVCSSACSEAAQPDQT